MARTSQHRYKPSRLPVFQAGQEPDLVEFSNKLMEQNQLAALIISAVAITTEQTKDSIQFGLDVQAMVHASRIHARLLVATMHEHAETLEAAIARDNTDYAIATNNLDLQHWAMQKFHAERSPDTPLQTDAKKATAAIASAMSANYGFYVCAALTFCADQVVLVQANGPFAHINRSLLATLAAQVSLDTPPQTTEGTDFEKVREHALREAEQAIRDELRTPDGAKLLRAAHADLMKLRN